MTKLKPTCRSRNEIVHAVNFMWGNQYRRWEVLEMRGTICLLNWNQHSGTQYGNTPKLIPPMFQSRLGFFPFCITQKQHSFNILLSNIHWPFNRHDIMFKILNAFKNIQLRLNLQGETNHRFFSEKQLRKIFLKAMAAYLTQESEGENWMRRSCSLTLSQIKQTNKHPPPKQ